MDRIPLSDESGSLDEDQDFDVFADDVSNPLDFDKETPREYEAEEWDGLLSDDDALGDTEIDGLLNDAPGG